MRFVLFISLVCFSFSAMALKINGTFKNSECGTDQSMIWLATDHNSFKDRKLLLHTLVPKGGTFSFYVKPGSYQVRGSDKKGCESFAKVDIKETDKNIEIELKGE